MSSWSKNACIDFFTNSSRPRVVISWGFVLSAGKRFDGSDALSRFFNRLPLFSWLLWESCRQRIWNISCSAPVLQFNLRVLSSSWVPAPKIKTGSPLFVACPARSQRNFLSQWTTKDGATWRASRFSRRIADRLMFYLFGLSSPASILAASR